MIFKVRSTLAMEDLSPPLYEFMILSSNTEQASPIV